MCSFIAKVLNAAMWWTVVVVVGLVRTAVGNGGNADNWWGNAVYYRILVDSFKDGDGDGLGDLKGATKQLSYVRAVGADAIILSPISSRSTDCSKPGVIDVSEIEPRYGNLEAFTGLLNKAKKLELKILVSLPLQTISTSSDWFISSADRAFGFEDWVLWRDGSPDEPPLPENDIKWQWHDTRNAFWASSSEEAVLNLCSEGVAAAIAAAQCAWLRRGVSGVLLDPDFQQDLSCGEKLLKQLAAEAMSCARASNLETPVILVESSLEPNKAARYYADGGVGANTVLSPVLTSSARKTAAELGAAFYGTLLSAPQDAASAWMSSSTNGSHISTRYGNEMVDTINLLSLILPGAAVILQGDELGTADTILEWATSTNCWPRTAHPASAPFPWDDTVNAGFTSGEPWLPVAPNYRYANAKTEYANDLSHLGVVKLMAALRKSLAIGPHVEIKRLNGALGVLRWGGSGSLLVVTNLARETTEVQLNKIPGLPHEMTVAASSAGSSFSPGSHISTDKTLKLIPGETLLLAGAPRHCGGPGPVDKIASKLSEGWQKINKYFSNI